MLYQLNGSDWYPASTANRWTNWNVILDLTPGTNVLSAYAVDVVGLISATNTVRFTYATAPTSLSGMKAQLDLDAGSSYEIAFGANTFSQSSRNTNNFNSVGSYAYAMISPTTASLKLTYTAPPLTTNVAAQTIVLNFNVPGVARFTNGTLPAIGNLTLTTITTLVPATLASQAIVYVASNGGAKSNVYSAINVMSTEMMSGILSKWSNYTYTVYSPLGALVKQTGTNGTSYIVTSYLSTNFSLAYQENYDRTGVLSATDIGYCGVASQRTGGNASTNLTGRALSFLSLGSSFKLSLAATNFAQYSPTPDYNTGVGSYGYTRSGTNVGQINLAYAAPLDIAGLTSAASLRFIAPNVAVYTNADATYGITYVGNALNYSPASLSGLAITITNNAATIVSQFNFAADGTFTVIGYLNGSGTYAYSTYSLEGSLAQLAFSTGGLAGDTAAFQLQYGGATTGRFQLSIFDATNAPAGTIRGVFGQ